MKRNKYSAGAVKLSFWFMEFRKEVQLGSDGKFYEVLADSKAIMMAEDKFKVFKK